MIQRSFFLHAMEIPLTIISQIIGNPGKPILIQKSHLYHLHMRSTNLNPIAVKKQKLSNKEASVFLDYTIIYQEKSSQGVIFIMLCIYGKQSHKWKSYLTSPLVHENTSAENEHSDYHRIRTELWKEQMQCNHILTTVLK